MGEPGRGVRDIGDFGDIRDLKHAKTGVEFSQSACLVRTTWRRIFRTEA
jgi:hypothetical protein